jgi:hypothetical protein
MKSRTTSSPLLIFGLLALGSIAFSTPLAAQTTPSIFQMVNVPFSGIEVPAISASASNNVWAASGSFLTQTNANVSIPASLNFNGTKFSQTLLGQTVAGPTGAINGVAAISPTDVWAVGFDSVDNGPLEVVQHFDGTKWHQVSDVAMVGKIVGKGQILGEQLNAISALSASDIFVAGNLYNPDLDQVLPFFEHWNGQVWSQSGPTPTVSAAQTFITGISALSNTDVWAAGYILNLNGVTPKSVSAVTFHFDGTEWTEISGAACDCAFLGVTAIAPDDIWAVGFTQNGSTLASAPMAQHFNGSNWTLTSVPTPQPQSVEFTTFPNQFQGVAAVSSKSVWAVGTYLGNGISADVFHWDGSKWTQENLPPCPQNRSCGLFSATALPTGQVWAGGAASESFAPGPIQESPLIFFTNQGQ